jgi:phosphoglycolate phosphatase-like HAD superfamily hydrolase
MASNPPVKLVIFDLFGTLVRYGVMHHPFRKLLKWARDNGREVRPDDARYLMTNDLELKELAQSMGIFPPIELLNQISEEISQELDSLGLFEDVFPTLNKLHEKGIPIAVCSNLAHPYGRAIELLPAHIVEMKNRGIGTTVHTTLSSEDPAGMLPLQEALGYDLANSLFSQQRNLILEGIWLRSLASKV